MHGITDKVVNFVIDNAANMVKAFSLLPGMCHEMEDSEGKAVEGDTGTDTDGFENDVEVLSVTKLAQTTTHDRVQQTDDEIHSDDEDDDVDSIVTQGSQLLSCCCWNTKGVQIILSI